MDMQKTNVLAYTQKHPFLCGNICTGVIICKAGETPTGDAKENVFLAIWDTGANSSAISENAVKKLNLPTVSMTSIHTANGIAEQTTHLVDLGLPNKVVIRNLLVNSAKITSTIPIKNKNGQASEMPLDMLIGMDIISRGDFSISNYEGKTTFSFRMPSIAETDYDLQEKTRLSLTNMKTQPNAPCPCGSGKKYKFCCGK